MVYVIKLVTRGRYGDDVASAYLAFEKTHLELFNTFAESFGFLKRSVADVLPAHHIIALFKASGGHILTPTHAVDLDLGESKEEIVWRAEQLLMLKRAGIMKIPSYSIDKHFKPYDGSPEMRM